MCMDLDNERAAFVLEFLTYWGGGATASEIAAVLNMARETVQRSVISTYKREFPGAITYNKAKRRTAWVESAAPRFCPSDPSAVAAIVQADAVFALSSGANPLFDAPIEDVGLVADFLVEPDVEAFRVLFSALMQRTAVQVDYLAKSGPLSMTFSPHTLVRTSFRLHFRGYCDTAEGRPGIYIDVVPDRVLRAVWLDKASYVDANADTAWCQKVRIVATLCEELPDSIAAALRREHGISHGDRRKTKYVRAAVAPYVAEAFETRRVHGWDGPIWQTELQA